jgi:hypothetical protein
MTIQKPDGQVFKWLFFGQKLGPVFEWSAIWFNHSKTRPVIFSNSLEGFIQKNIIL